MIVKRLRLALVGSVIAVLAVSAGVSGNTGSDGTSPALSPSFFWGWATVRTVNANYTLAAGDHRSSSGGSVKVKHLSAGHYQVIFKGIGNDGGVALVSQIGTKPRVCEVGGWSRAGAPANLLVAVDCFRVSTGNAADSAFSLTYLATSGDTGRWRTSTRPGRPPMRPRSPSTRSTAARCR